MKRILVAVDLSDVSNLVVRRAVDIARPTGARVRLIRAVPLPPAPPPGTYFPPQTASILEAAERSLAPVAEQIPPELRDGAAIEFGDPAGAVCRVAGEYGADLVVIGAHRYGLLARALGTTAARVVNRCDRPVLVVRPLPAEVATGVEQPAPVDLLRQEHARIETGCERMLSAYRGGDWNDVRVEWDLFEAALRRHLEVEEQDIFPGFRKADPSETSALEADHAELRRVLDDFGVRLELHAIPVRDIEELVARVRAHGAREDKLHAWVSRQRATAMTAPLA